MTPDGYERRMDTQIHERDQAAFVRLGLFQQFPVHVQAGRIMKIKKASAAQAVGVAILAARHPGPGQGSEAPGKLAGSLMQDFGQW
jgi:hypothetical protein